MNINQKEILNETLTRFNELQIDMSFIQRVFDTYNCYISVNTHCFVDSITVVTR